MRRGADSAGPAGHASRPSVWPRASSRRPAWLRPVPRIYGEGLPRPPGIGWPGIEVASARLEMGPRAAGDPERPVRSRGGSRANHEAPAAAPLRRGVPERLPRSSRGGCGNWQSSRPGRPSGRGEPERPARSQGGRARNGSHAARPRRRRLVPSQVVWEGIRGRRRPMRGGAVGWPGAPAAKGSTGKFRRRHYSGGRRV